MLKKERAIILEFLALNISIRKKITMKNSAVTLSTKSPRFTHPSSTIPRP